MGDIKPETLSFWRMMPDSLKPTVREILDERARRNGICIDCGINEVAMPQMDLCLECARASCVLDTGARFKTRSEKGFAIAYREECGGHDDDTSSCTGCHGTRWISHKDSRGYVWAERCPGQDLDERLELFNNAKLPGKHRDATFSGMDTSHPGIAKAVRKCSEWADGFNIPMTARGLALAGGHGTGKTHVLTAIARTLTIKHRVQCRYLDWGDLVKELEDGIGGENRRDPGSVLRPYVTVSVLLLDELGKGKSSQFRLDQLDWLIERRYRDDATRTVVATNFNDENLSELCGDRALSRLREMTTEVLMIAPDRRRT